MSIAFKCKSCGKHGKVKDDLAGRKVKCKCGNVMVVPAPTNPTNDVEAINILMATARPYEGDVRFRSISRPVIELRSSGFTPLESVDWL